MQTQSNPQDLDGVIPNVPDFRMISARLKVCPLLQYVLAKSRRNLNVSLAFLLRVKSCMNEIYVIRIAFLSPLACYLWLVLPGLWGRRFLWPYPRKAWFCFPDTLQLPQAACFRESTLLLAFLAGNQNS